MIQPTDLRILNLMIEKIDRLTSIIKQNTLKEIESNFVLSDSLQYEFEKLYEDTTRLSSEFRITHRDFPYDELRAIRNRVAHDYESVIIEILYDTVNKNIPDLKAKIIELLNS